MKASFHQAQDDNPTRDSIMSDEFDNKRQNGQEPDLSYGDIEAAAPEDPGLSAGAAESADSQKDCEELKKQLKAVQNSASEAQDLYKRMAADFENYRKRTDRERREFLTLGIQKAAEALFPALDDLDRAQSALSTDMPLENILESLTIVFNKINQSLERLGVKPITGVGEHFDPQFHEPVQQIRTLDQPDGAIVEVLRKGYSINGKVVRPALVNVAASPHDTEKTAAPAEPTEAQT